MGKDLESLKESRNIRSMLIAKWGCVPTSIWQVDWKKSRNQELSERSYQNHKQSTKYADTPFSLSGVGARHGDLSRFPQDVGNFLVTFLCPERGLVLDPFAGHNSRCELVWRSRRDYIGFDISHTFMEANSKIRSMLYEENERNLLDKNEAKISLIESDSRNILDYVDKNSVDFCLSSPPFYDLEWYGDEPEQLGRSKTYNDFLYSLGKIVENCYQVLKPGCYITWEFNDFRREGIFYPYHIDGMMLFKKAGFMLHDVVIIDYGSSFFESFLSDVEHNKVMPKRHSYIVIARKYKVAHGPKREQTREKLLEQTKEFHNDKAKQAGMF